MAAEYLVPCHCHKCGVIGESRLSWAGPHIKQSCPECGAYQKFYDKALIPDVREIKIRIWGKTKGNLYAITIAKAGINFVEGLTGLDAKLEYYKLFKSI